MNPKEPAIYQTPANVPRVAVIGAGIAGLAAARALSVHDYAVKVFERSRGVGGRSAHRQRDEFTFDHGTQYFTARDPGFVQQVESWIEAGLVAPWNGRIVSLAMGRVSPLMRSAQRYVGIPGMNAMAKDLAGNLDAHLQSAVTALKREGNLWYLAVGDADMIGPFDSLILAMPPEQAARLLPAGDLLTATKRTRMLPSWCAMAAFDEPLAVDFDAAFVNSSGARQVAGAAAPAASDDSVLDWIARDSSKPGRSAGERWVIHAVSGWSAQRLDASPDTVARELLDFFFQATGVTRREPQYVAGHRWSFARPATENTIGCLWSPHDSVAVCGDWCSGGRIESAWLSGVAAAERIHHAERPNQHLDTSG